MANDKLKKATDLSNTEIQDQPINDENKLKKEVNKNTSAANTSQQSMQQGVSSINQAKKAQAEEMQKQQQGSDKEEFLNRTRDSLDTQFKDAMTYFGPRLVAQLFGGTSAMAMTDRVMSGFEGYQARQLAAKEHAEDRKHLLEQRRLQALQGPQLSTADRRLAFEEKKYREEKAEKSREKIEKQQSSMEDINQTIQQTTDAMKDLKMFPKSVGYFAGSEQFRTIDKMSDDADAVGREGTRFKLQTIFDSKALEKLQKLTGQKSDFELRFAQKAVPTLRSSKKVIDEWLQGYQKALGEQQKLLQKKQGAERQRSQQFAPGSIIQDQTGKQYVVMPDGSYREK